MAAQENEDSSLGKVLKCVLSSASSIVGILFAPIAVQLDAEIVTSIQHAVHTPILEYSGLYINTGALQNTRLLEPWEVVAMLVATSCDALSNYNVLENIFCYAGIIIKQNLKGLSNNDTVATDALQQQSNQLG